MVKKEALIGEKEFQSLLQRLASELREEEKRGEPYYLVGIHSRGIPLAQRLAQLMKTDPARIGSLDINLYRDDLSSASPMPVLRETRIPFDVQGKSILLVDDVLYTGRTVRAALDALIDLGRPKQIQLLALVDRGGRELPIQPDFCGLRQRIGKGENVKVRLKETDGYDGVELLKAPS